LVIESIQAGRKPFDLTTNRTASLPQNDDPKFCSIFSFEKIHDRRERAKSVRLQEIFLFAIVFRDSGVLFEARHTVLIFELEMFCAA